MDLPSLHLAPFRQLRMDAGGSLLARCRRADFPSDRFLLRARATPEQRFFARWATERNSLAGRSTVTYAEWSKNY